MAPLGIPVVPPVYCKTATSSGDIFAGSREEGVRRISMSGETPGRQGTATPGDGPQYASSPTQTRSTRPSA